ncbi:Centromere protein I [Trinorchestia longiramus]|nr:Centromere protein I [Trinorchestia longiramus]
MKHGSTSTIPRTKLNRSSGCPRMEVGQSKQNLSVQEERLWPLSSGMQRGSCHHVSKEDRDQLQVMVNIVHSQAMHHGLQAKHMKMLTSRVICSDTYGISIRRKLLYSLIPEKPDSFPYEILPCLMSTVYPAALEKPKGTKSWANSVLGWLASLLRFNILNSDNIYVRLCYFPCFYLLGHFRLMRHCTDIIYELTRRVDVTPFRVKYLLKLKKMKLFVYPYTKLLRLFSTMRPDLIVISDESLALPRNTPPNKLMVAGLKACSRRLSAVHHDPHDVGDSLWASAYKRQKFNPHARSSALPIPKVVQHSDTLEEKQAQHINVMQCTKLRQLISTINRSEAWLWPNNPASLLRRPLLVLWFRPLDYRVTLQLESWLDLALSSEVLKEREVAVGSERSHDLLYHVTQFAEQQLLSGKLCSPVIQQFLLSHFMCWDQQQNLALVLRLVRCLGYIQSFTSVVVSRLLPLLANAPVSMACAVIRCFTDTAVNWCLHYHHNTELLEDEGLAMVEGVLDLSRQLESSFITCCLAHSMHPMLLHTVISFYSTVNACLDQLVLPLVLCPSPPLVALLLSATDMAVTHALGILFSRLPMAYVRLDEKFMQQNRYTDFCSEVFKGTLQQNKAIELFASSTYDAYVFFHSSECWKEMCSIFLGAKVVAEAEKITNLRSSMSVVTSLQSVALSAQVARATEAQLYTGGNFYKIRDDLLDVLSGFGLSGVTDFIKANQETDTPVQ